MVFIIKKERWCPECEKTHMFRTTPNNKKYSCCPVCGFELDERDYCYPDWKQRNWKRKLKEKAKVQAEIKKQSQEMQDRLKRG